MAEPLELLFWLWAWVGSRNHVLDGVQIPAWRALQTDDKQTTGGRVIAYSEREREFTFAKNLKSP